MTASALTAPPTATLPTPLPAAGKPHERLWGGNGYENRYAKANNDAAGDGADAPYRPPTHPAYCRCTAWRVGGRSRRERLPARTTLNNLTAHGNG